MSDLPALVHPAPEHAPVATVPVDTPSVFAKLICADPGLLRAEFEALIAANYPPGDGHHSRRPPRRTRPLRTDRTRPAPRAVSSSGQGPCQDPPAGRAGPGPTEPPGNAARPEDTHTPNSAQKNNETSDSEVIDRPTSRLSETDARARYHPR
jgi:hypothetical protein